MKPWGLRISLVAALIITLMTALAVYSQDDVVTVEDDAIIERMRPIAPFEHELHNELAEIDECGVCHHVYDEDGQLIEDETSEDMQCSECHLTDDDDKMDLVMHYHNRCKNCHLERNAGPIMCAECHVKKNTE